MRPRLLLCEFIHPGVEGANYPRTERADATVASSSVSPPSMWTSFRESDRCTTQNASWSPIWGRVVRSVLPYAESAGVAGRYWKRRIARRLRLNLQATLNAGLSECTSPY